ncbi:MAG: substrate-binding domain-containing protein, partial [Victivallales bacterium]|nr:substrate-binding domain-containing protein [Victivallales bacterium]
EGRVVPFSARIAENGSECVVMDLKSLSNTLAGVDSSDYPIGVFAVTDDVAVAVMKLLRDAGIVIGRDAYLVGYDDLHLTAALDPPLTTVRQPFREQGARAVDKLLNMIYGGEENDEALSPHLVERASA